MFMPVPLCCLCDDSSPDKPFQHVSIVNGLQTRDEASKQLEESKKTAEAQWNAAQKQYQKATPANQKASKKTWDLAQKARDEVGQALPLSCICCLTSCFFSLNTKSRDLTCQDQCSPVFIACQWLCTTWSLCMSSSSSVLHFVGC